MEHEQFQQIPTAPYPAPPPFWKYFTTQNHERIKNANSDAELPIELNFLRPPPPPAEDAESYTTFSTQWPLDPTPALPPPDVLLFDPSSPAFNHAKALKQLTNSLLLNFLELTGVLSNDPIKYEEKMQDIERLMLNAHFVINLYRPHQAREGVKEMLQDQLDKGRQEIQRCDEMRQKVDNFLVDIQQQQIEPVINSKGHTDTEENRHARQLWKLIHDLKDN